jgi:hypothetical protein
MFARDYEVMLMDSSRDLIKQMISLSTIILGITLTFWKETPAEIPQRWRWTLPAAWLLFFISVVAGVIAFMLHTGSLYDAIHHPEIIQKRGKLMDPLVQVSAGIMQIAFVLGTLLVMNYGRLAFRARMRGSNKAAPIPPGDASKK